MPPLMTARSSRSVILSTTANPSVCNWASCSSWPYCKRLFCDFPALVSSILVTTAIGRRAISGRTTFSVALPRVNVPPECGTYRFAYIRRLNWGKILTLGRV